MSVVGLARDDDNQCAHAIIGAAIEVHRHLGPGLFESAYERALVEECRLRGLRALNQLLLPVHYKGIELPDAYRIDLLVNDLVIVEIKATERVASVYENQLMTYLKFSGKRLGLLINFNRPVLVKGIRRVVVPGSLRPPPVAPSLI